MIVFDHTGTVHIDIKAGIQRVVVQLGSALAGKAPDVFVPVIYRQGSFFRFPIGATLDSYFSHKVRRLAWRLGAGPLSAVRRLSNQSRLLFRVKASLFACLEALEDTSARVSLRPGDWYLTADSIWIYPEILEEIRALKAQDVRTAIVLYDLIPVTSPQWVYPGHRERFMPYAEALPSFDAVFCISDCVREEFLAFCQERGYQVPPHVVTIPMGYQFAQTARPSAPTVPEIAQGEFGLCVGTLEPRKNHQALLDAFDILWEKGVALSLVIVGKPSFRSEETLARIHRHPLLGKKLFYRSNCDDGELEELYRRCRFTILPSLMEGFGLPLLESLSRGKPCLCSDISVFKNIAGEFGVYCNPTDPRSIVAQIENLGLDRARLEAMTTLISTKYRPPCWEDSAQVILDTLAAANPGRKRPIAQGL